MKKFHKIIAATVTVFATSIGVRAQYYEIANQLSQVISPALSGSLSYKGYVEASGLAGFGTSRANFLGISTSQGFKYSSWFFMGVGVGVDVAMANEPDGSRIHDYPMYDTGASRQGDYNYGPDMSTTKAMIPVFTDFRFNIGDMSKTGFFIDIKLGAAWLIGSSYLQMQDAYMTNETQFYLRPTLGVRIPVNKKKPKQAVNIGATYQLLTSNNNYYYWDGGSSITLNNLGLTVGYEW